MAVQQQTPMSARIPPDVPNDPKLSTETSQYLRNFALWARNGFAEQMRNNEAVPGLLVRAYDAPAGANPPVFIIQVASDGTIVANPVPLGGGNRR